MNKMQFESAVTTLYEGHYHYGVVALLNSLIHSGFKGIFRIGYRGDLPVWTSQLISLGSNDFLATDSLVISFVYTNPDMHFGYYKPKFIKDTLSEFPSIEKIYYFDPDIVIDAPWLFFSKWVQSGVALCLDNCFHFVHRNHPWRKDWAELANFNPDRISELDYYVNSGFIGLKSNDVTILDRWLHLTENYKAIGGNLQLFEKDGHRAFKGDQDLLNAVITVSPELKISLIGKEGMGFSQPAYLMSHAVSSIKPWKKIFLKDLLRL